MTLATALLPVLVGTTVVVGIFATFLAHRAKASISAALLAAFTVSQMIAAVTTILRTVDFDASSDARANLFVLQEIVIILGIALAGWRFQR